MASGHAGEPKTPSLLPAKYTSARPACPNQASSKLTSLDRSIDNKPQMFKCLNMDLSLLKLGASEDDGQLRAAPPPPGLPIPNWLLP